METSDAMTTREKLAAVLCIDDASKAVATLDALEAIVAEARDEAIEGCASVVAGPEWLSSLNPMQAFERVALAAVLRTLKTKARKT